MVFGLVYPALCTHLSNICRTLNNRSSGNTGFAINSNKPSSIPFFEDNIIGVPAREEGFNVGIGFYDLLIHLSSILFGQDNIYNCQVYLVRGFP